MADRKESAADISVTMKDSEDITVERLTLTKEIDVEEVYGSGAMIPDGYSVTQISYQGSVEFVGDRFDLESKLFDSNGAPVTFNITVTHIDGKSTKFQECLITSAGYEMNSG